LPFVFPFSFNEESPCIRRDMNPTADHDVVEFSM
jgi:hypothetical protein